MIESKFRKLVAEILGVSEESICYETDFIQDMGIDSLKLMQLVNAIECKYKIVIDDTKIVNLTTFGSAYEYVSTIAPHGDVA